MKNNLIFAVLLISVGHINSQTSGTSIDNKYLNAIIYLKTNSEIVSKINNFHGHWVKDNKLKKSHNTNFNISKYIKFIPIHNLKKDDSLDSKSYREKYYFKFEEELFFEKIIPRTDSKLFLIFSKPLDNYLCAEFAFNFNDYEFDLVDNINGPVIQIMFVFDNDNIVKDFLVYSSYVN
jgi:hypothetical protein